MQIARALRAAAGTSAGLFGTGVLIRASQSALVDIEATGAADTAILVDGTSFAAIVASDVHDNPGAVAGRDNWFVDEARSTLSAPPRIRRGR